MVIVLGLLCLGIEVPCLLLVDEITELFLPIEVEIAQLFAQPTIVTPLVDGFHVIEAFSLTATLQQLLILVTDNQGVVERGVPSYAMYQFFTIHLFSLLAYLLKECLGLVLCACKQRGTQDFVARNKARVATRNMAMSRQKKLDKMDVIELAAEKPKPEFNFKVGKTPGRYLFETKELVIGYDEPLSKPLTLEMERGKKIVLTGANGIGKTTLLKCIMGSIKQLDGSITFHRPVKIGYIDQHHLDIRGKSTLVEDMMKDFDGETIQSLREETPLNALGTPKDIADAAVFLCSDKAKFITGQVLGVNGGFII